MISLVGLKRGGMLRDRFSPHPGSRLLSNPQPRPCCTDNVKCNKAELCFSDFRSSSSFFLSLPPPPVNFLLMKTGVGVGEAAHESCETSREMNIDEDVISFCRQRWMAGSSSPSADLTGRRSLRLLGVHWWEIKYAWDTLSADSSVSCSARFPPHRELSRALILEFCNFSWPG